MLTVTTASFITTLTLALSAFAQSSASIPTPTLIRSSSLRHVAFSSAHSIPNPFQTLLSRDCREACERAGAVQNDCVEGSIPDLRCACESAQYQADFELCRERNCPIVKDGALNSERYSTCVRNSRLQPQNCRASSHALRHSVFRQPKRVVSIWWDTQR
ncbi:hypothetical protein BKA70DRAFT_1446640 [Coprinopsis sp. MPI-PUGE-AT-0042]|nr:hypothetical protein BKA70DRAFT_1446640 [Coprinopsis sp. MPI-PUGE-AT-0042]